MILGLEVSADHCSAALLQGGHCRLETSQSGRAADRLLPLVERLIGDDGVDPSAIQAIAFGAGPGGFTGLRVACAVAQGLGWAWQRPLIGVDSLAAIAWRMAQTPPGCDPHANLGRQVAVAIDARMQEIYAGLYAVDLHGQLTTLRAPWLANASALQAELALACNPPTAWAAAGDAFRVHAGLLAQPFLRVDAQLAPRADAIAWLGSQRLAAGEGLDPAQAAPVYVRDKVALNRDEQAQLRAARIAIVDRPSDTSAAQP